MTGSSRRSGPPASDHAVSPETRDLSRTSVGELVKAFERGTLPRSGWSHGAHLVIGLWYVLHYGPERAFTLMSEGIQRYNSVSGRTEAERLGYSAATTRMWIQRIAEFARQSTVDSPEGTLFRRILTSPLAADAGAASPAIAGDAAGDPAQITGLLQRGPGDERAERELFDLVYDELCAIAGRRMRAERADHTLQATALVHEAYLRLVRDRDMKWSSRRHFFGAAARAMRRILVDHARYVRAERRRDPGARMSLSAAELAFENDPHRLVELDDALEQLASEDARSAEVVQLRYFAGMSLEETAEALGLSVRTVTRDWTYARAWLRDRLQ